MIATCIGPFANFVYRPLLESNFWLGTIVGAIVLSAGFMAGAGLMEAIAERMSRLHNFEYGQARMWGSFGYALVALVAGFLFVVNPALNFWVGSAFGFALLLVQLLWKVKEPVHVVDGIEGAPSVPGIREMLGLLKMPTLWAVILSAPMGALRDSIGYQPTFFVISAIVAVAGVYAFFVLKPDDKDVLGDPFIRDGAKTDTATIAAN